MISKTSQKCQKVTQESLYTNQVTLTCRYFFFCSEHCEELKHSHAEVIWRWNYMAAQEDPENILCKWHQFLFLCLCLVLACVTVKISANMLGRYLQLKVKGQSVERWVDISCIVLTLKTLLGIPALIFYLICFDLVGFMDFKMSKQISIISMTKNKIQEIQILVLQQSKKWPKLSYRSKTLNSCRLT